MFQTDEMFSGETFPVCWKFLNEHKRTVTTFRKKKF